MANMAQAMRMALHYGEKNLGVTDIFGEDVGAPQGGVFTVTQGLRTAWNTPLDERGIIGTAMGLAMAGQKPVAEIQFCDYIYNTIDLLKLAGNSCWASHGAFPLPMVVMTIAGAGIHGSLYHSHSFDAVATHLAGWKIVMPSNPVDAYGLMLSALQDGNPVLYMAPKALLRYKGDALLQGEPSDERELKRRIDQPVGMSDEARKRWVPDWPEIETEAIPLGVAARVREGDRAVIVTYGRHVHLAKAAADKVAERGLGEAQVLDLRTLYPYDWRAVSNAVKQTGRVLFVNEDGEVSNFGEHLLRRVIEEHFYELRARPRLLAGLHVPGVGLAPTLENVSVPQESDIERELTELLKEAT